MYVSTAGTSPSPFETWCQAEIERGGLSLSPSLLLGLSFVLVFEASLSVFPFRFSSFSMSLYSFKDKDLQLVSQCEERSQVRSPREKNGAVNVYVQKQCLGTPQELLQRHTGREVPDGKGNPKGYWGTSSKRS